MMLKPQLTAEMQELENIAAVTAGIISEFIRSWRPLKDLKLF